jgi:hypothetical protein
MSSETQAEYVARMDKLRDAWLKAQQALSTEATYLANLACNGELPDATSRDLYARLKSAEQAAADAYFGAEIDQ